MIQFQTVLLAALNPSLIILVSCLILFRPSAMAGEVAADKVENFFSAIVQNETNAAWQMLESDTNLAQATYNFSKLPLLQAAAAGNLQLTKRLVELGADLNARGDTLSSGGFEGTALHEAVRYGHVAVAQWLLEAGSDPNAMAFGFTTPLHLAFASQQEKAAELLLDYGADAFREKGFLNDHTTPFETAIVQGTGRLVPRMLGQQPQNPPGRKARGKERNHEEMVRIVSKVLAERGPRLLNAAVERSELEAVEALMRAGVPANQADERGRSPLQIFASVAAEAATNRPLLLQQLEHTRQLIAETTNRVDPGMNPDHLLVLRSIEASQETGVAPSDPQRLARIRELLIQHGASQMEKTNR